MIYFEVMNKKQSIIGSVKCSKSNSYETNFHFSIGLPFLTFDCYGTPVSFVPDIGIESETGVIANFHPLSRSIFCDSFYVINAKNGENSISSKY
jgi:hypothetical protein